MPLPDVLRSLGLDDHPRLKPRGHVHPVNSPTTGQPLASVVLDDAAVYEKAVASAVEGFKRWREVPAPERGQVVRAIGEAFRTHKAALGELISIEVGKIRAEGLGEVQEAIDIADLAVGLSRQLPGMTMPSERRHHRLMEQWHPLGPIGVITAFNFPAAVWAWNAMIAAVCGDAIVWKPSLLAPMTALACHEIADRAATAMGHAGVFKLVIGTDATVGEKLLADKRLPLISATGSCRMGKRVAQVVGGRLGRSLLELGGNNACIVSPEADLDLALKAIVFSAVGTAGQRCTTTRRLIVHASIADAFTAKLAAAYKTIRIGDPLAEGTLVGPLITATAVEGFEAAVRTAIEQGGTVIAGGKRAKVPGLAGHFVEPTIIRAPASNELAIARQETFAPILYVFTYEDLGDAIAMNNGVDQGLSSAIFSKSMLETERFIGPAGTDCGLAYVNLATSGAEIGGAFGGEKDTGGGRESGSDSWKAYMRRQTATIHYGRQLSLAQGIRFE
jgi:aldehyde dehydrogenase (NAD+)